MVRDLWALRNFSQSTALRDVTFDFGLLFKSLFPFVPSLPDQEIVLIHLYKIVWMEHLLLHQWQGMVLHHPRLWWECLCFHQDRWCLHHQVDLVSNYFFIGFYCMASSVSGQDNPNPALWLVVQAGKMALSWPLRTTHCVLQERIARKPCNKSLIDQAWLIKPYVMTDSDAYC